MVAHIFEPQNMFMQPTDQGVYASTQVVMTTNASAGTMITVNTTEWSVTASTDGMLFDYSYADTETHNNGATGCTNVLFEDIQWVHAERWAEAEAERSEKAKKAQDRAKTLLRRHLTPKQWDDYEEHGHFFLKTRKGHLYQIGSARDHNIVRLNRRRKPMRVLCISIYEVNVPLEDIMLAQKLMLETQEDAFLKIANHWGLQEAQGIRRAA